MNLGQKFADLEDAITRIYYDLRDIDRDSLSEEDREILVEAYALADIYMQVLTGNSTWEEGQKQMREVLE